MTGRRILTLVAASLFVLVVLLGATGQLNAERQVPQRDLLTQTARGATAAMLHFNLEEMTARADKIFRGTVVDIEPGSVAVSGAQLPTVTYTFVVDEAFKGQFDGKDGISYTVIQMLGSIKDAGASGDVKHFAVLPDPPQLRMGSDYMLFTTPASAIGLSTAVGVGQGSFEIFSIDKQDWAQNEYNNAGLYDGAVPYAQLASDVQALVGQ